MPKSKSYIIREPEDSFGYLMNRAGRAMSNNVREKLAAAGVELPMEHLIILFHLWHKDGRSQKDIVDKVFKDKTTITRALDSLEKLNLLLRVPDETDKRSKRVFLTHKGKTLKKKVMPIAIQTNIEAIADIPMEHLEICKSVLVKIYENATKG